ncbi:MAG: histidine kinase, partial [Hydrogenobaculum sp.]
MRWLNINTFKKKVNLVLGLLVLLIVLASNVGFVLNLKHNPSINIYAFLAIININLFALLLAVVIIFRKFI